MRAVLTRPEDSDFAAENWHLLTRFWHPVAFTQRVTARLTGALELYGVSAAAPSLRAGLALCGFSCAWS